MHIFVQMHLFLLTLDLINGLCLVYSDFYANKIVFKVCNRS